MKYYNISIIHWIVWAYIYQWRIDDEMKTSGKTIDFFSTHDMYNIDR